MIVGNFDYFLSEPIRFTGVFRLEGSFYEILFQLNQNCFMVHKYRACFYSGKSSFVIIVVKIHNVLINAISI